MKSLEFCTKFANISELWQRRKVSKLRFEPSLGHGSSGAILQHRSGHLAAVSALLGADADPNAAVHNGATPLFVAAEMGHMLCFLSNSQFERIFLISTPSVFLTSSNVSKTIFRKSQNIRIVTSGILVIQQMLIFDSFPSKDEFKFAEFGIMIIDVHQNC